MPKPKKNSMKATGHCRVDDNSAEEQIRAHTEALRVAAQRFYEENKTPPNWEFILFRGCHTTFEVVVEIWEDDS